MGIDDKMKNSLIMFLAVLALMHINLTNAHGMDSTPAINMTSVVSTSRTSGYVICSSGYLWAWGDNRFGQLGDGTTLSSYSPIKVLSEVVAVSAGFGHALAIREDGTLWAWGWNGYGQLGNGTTESQYLPVKIFDDVIYVSADYTSTMVLRSDGSLWGWGWVGFEETDISHVPMKLMEGVASISTASDYTMVIKSDGSLWAWGDNSFGQLGDGTAIHRKSPVKVMADVVYVSAGQLHTMAITTDGNLWAWGDNSFGQLGDGTTIDRNMPVRIMDNVMLPGGMEPTEPLPPPANFPTYNGFYLDEDFFIDGNAASITSYRINGLRHVKLRDIAYALNDTDSRFNITWVGDINTIVITTGQNYAPARSERVAFTDAELVAMRSPVTILIDGREPQVRFSTYNLGGSTFVELSSLSGNFVFDVDISFLDEDSVDEDETPRVDIISFWPW